FAPKLPSVHYVHQLCSDDQPVAETKYSSQQDRANTEFMTHGARSDVALLCFVHGMAGHHVQIARSRKSVGDAFRQAGGKIISGRTTALVLKRQYRHRIIIVILARLMLGGEVRWFERVFFSGL